MKLVDILAREITEWPQGQPCLWISDAHSATIYGKSGSFEVSFNGDWPCPEDYLYAIVYKAEWQAAVDALKADEYHEPDNGVEAWLHGVERDYGNDAAQKCRAIINEARLKLERSKACDAIYGVLTGATVERKGNTSDMAEALYDAGYRKFEIVDN